MSAQITIPSIDEFEEFLKMGGHPIEATPYAMAGGLDHYMSAATDTWAPIHVWTRTASDDIGDGSNILGTKLYAYMHSTLNTKTMGLVGTYHPTNVERNVIGLLPIIKNAADDDFDVQKHNGKEVLTHKGKVVHYPQGALGPTDADTLAHNIRNNIVFTNSNNDIAYMAKSGGLFRRSKYEIARHGTYISNVTNYNTGINFPKDRTAFYTWEPVEATKLKSTGDIIFKKCLLPSFVDSNMNFKSFALTRGFKHGADIDIYGTKLSDFLNREFCNDLRKTALEKHKRPVSIDEVKTTTANDKKVSKFSIGDRVKIKCEGKEGIVKHLAGDIATLAVEGRQLKYRTEDLTLDI